MYLEFTVLHVHHIKLFIQLMKLLHMYIHLSIHVIYTTPKLFSCDIYTESVFL